MVALSNSNTKKKQTPWKYKWILLPVFLFLSFTICDDWGFYAHKQINELAIYTLPQEMLGFYKDHLEYLREHAVDPDKRRYSIVGEAEKHYIDIDHYCFGDSLCNPFDQVPTKWKDAVEKYTQDTLQAYGIAPWNLNNMVYRLRDAFEDLDEDKILRLSAELGHYVGDIHVPLHTTENYNGQLTGQEGIHSFWESRVPELFDWEFDFFMSPAQYIDYPLENIWDIIQQSNAAVDSVLSFEAKLNDSWTSDEKYVYEERGQALVKTYSEAYTKAYQNMLDGQVERRMRLAIQAVGNLWFTAWVNAGQPELPRKDKKRLFLKRKK